MTSSMLTGERRFTSARRGGLTVLGKVAVPKPLNLPSQRLENHGQDPGVEIVPKGTLSWGSKTSSSTPNAWTSSTLSPNADGGTSLPSRPSTAGSDKTHEPSMSAWTSNSRPSSASGALSSSQASLTSLRPRSAEPRPGSSQLSRFAESGSNIQTAWGPGSSAERLAVLNAKNDGFSLSSGDFPSLGSEKDNREKTSEPQEHDFQNGEVDTWRRDGPQHVDNGTHVWQGDPHQFSNSDVRPQHFDAWHGPMPPPTGVWYRGHPGAPPYGPHVGPGGFQFEQYPYYGPHQIPHLANSQPVPSQGHGPRGSHPRSNDLYRAQMPDTCIHPGMPFRPGYYPGPVAFEGYYGPPMGYYNSSERDISLMGMPTGPAVLNRYPAPNVQDANHSHARAARHGGANNTFLQEHGEPAHPDCARQPYKVLLKHHGECDRGVGGEDRKWPTPAITVHGERRFQPGGMKNEWEVCSSDEAMIENSNLQDVDNQRGDFSDNVKFKSVEGLDNVRTAPDNWVGRSVTTESTHKMTMQRGPVLAVAGNESNLMKKIEGLNAKVRGHESHFDSRSDEQSRAYVNSKVDNFIGDESRSSSKHFETTHASDISRTSYHGTQGRSDHYPAKAKFNHHDDGWRKQPLSAECSSMCASHSTVPSSSVQSNISYPQIEDMKHTLSSAQEKDEKEFMPESFDGQTQRAKKEELEKRALQLRKEEEERTREQKAKALAKLEELNRRMQGGDDASSTQKSEKAKQEQVQCALIESPDEPLSTKPDDVVEVNERIPPSQGDETADLQPMIEQGPTLTHQQEFGLAGPKQLTLPPSDRYSKQRQNVSLPSQGDETAVFQPMIEHSPTLTRQEDLNTASAKQPTLPSSDIHNKRTAGHKQRQNVAIHKDLNRPSAPSMGTSDPPKNYSDASTDGDILGGESKNPIAISTLTESGLQQRKKGNRNGKNKQKMDDTRSIPAASLPTAMQADSTTGKSSENEVLVISSVRATIKSDNVLQISEPHTLSKEGHGRVNDQRKPQHPHRISRNQRGNRFGDKSHGSDAVVWAPVQPQAKHVSDIESSQKKVLPDDHTTPTMGDNVMHRSSHDNSSKSKRAEMERYVPKPIAKEMAQQASGHQHHTSLTFGTHTVSVNADSNLDGWGMPIDTGAQHVSFGTVDEVGSTTGKGKLSSSTRQDCDKSTVKAARSDNGRNSRNSETGRNHSQPVVVQETKEMDKTAVGAKENRVTVSHWKPKSYVNAPPHCENQNEVQDEVYVKQQREEPRREVKQHSQKREEPRREGKLHSQQREEPRREGKQHSQQWEEPRREGKQHSQKWEEPRREGNQHSYRGGRPFSPNQPPPVGLNDEDFPAETQHSRRFTSSGFRRGGTQSHHHISRGGGESSEDWSAGPEDNREMRRYNNNNNNNKNNSNNMHYEYQPVGQHNNKSGNSGVPAAFSSQNAAPKYRETGHSRRGSRSNFYERRGTANYD
ncbi:hypothetical protein DM860_006736 [Cuscuta australis]|uniref:BAT2 N-terminal domain-containing protein n=1 Tax=Cuscuta australis TaxID=267555 RepID=A0A328D538_9ASTE|nr:hypothetical protein DM860_006736 [Cuscuta australis]